MPRSTPALAVLLSLALPCAAQKDLHGDPLPPHALARCGAVRWEHGAELLALAFSPDGKTVATVGRGSDLHLWDVDTGRQLRRAPLNLSPVFAVRYSPDGKTLVLAGHGGEVLVLNATTLARQRSLTIPDINCEVVTLSNDGRLLAANHTNKTVGVWSVPRGKRLMSYAIRSERVNCVSFAPDSKTIALALSWNGPVLVLDTVTGKEVGSFGD